VQHEKVINEEGDMVHIKTVITCLAAVCRVSTDAGKGSGFLTTFTRDSTRCPPIASPWLRYSRG
jgi:hypothetical protein